MKKLIDRLLDKRRIKRLENLIDAETILYYEIEELEYKGYDLHIYKKICYYNLEFYKIRYTELTGEEYYTNPDKILKALE